MLDERTACINRIRSALAKFSLAFAQSPKEFRTGPQVSQQVKSDRQAKRAAEVPGIGVLTASAVSRQWRIRTRFSSATQS